MRTKKAIAIAAFLSAVLYAAADAPVLMTRYFDRTEGAFFVLVPKGWTTRGGIARINPLTAQGGVGNASEAKLDFSVSGDASGKLSIRWIPKINYAQPSPANAMLGGNWNGMPIVPMPDAAGFISRLLFPTLRPQARNARVLSAEPRPDIVASVRQLPLAQAVLSQGGQFAADAAVVTVAYEENGVRFKESLFAAVEGYAMWGAALWDNPFTIAARAPEAEFDRWGALARTVVNSFSLNPVWLKAEMEGQARRADIAQATLKDLSRVDSEIAASRAKTMAAIREDQYLTLTAQELYVNPKTKEVELGSGEWKHRWVGPGGEVVYTDDGNWNPNRDPALKLSGFERSLPKRR